MPISRRELLRASAAAAMACLVRSSSSLAFTPKREPQGPRYIVLMLLHGGMDAIYTTDPKERSEVAANVDIPYAHSQIIDTGGMRLGPHLQPLARHAGKLAILNGVQVRTANHKTGVPQFFKLSTSTHPDMPWIMDVVGLHRQGQPLGCTSEKWLTHEFRTLLDTASAEDLQTLSKVLRLQAQELAKNPSGPRQSATARNLEAVSNLFARMGAVPRFKEESWFPTPPLAAYGTGAYQEMASYLTDDAARSLQRTLWLLENDLTRTVEVMIGEEQIWDSHNNNTAQQTQASSFFFTLARFLDELETRRNVHGSLAQNTLVVLGSEIGRYPQLNGQQGKDHFPEIPMMFFGSGIATRGSRGAVYGRTNRQMQGLPISLQSGDAAPSGQPMVLDDVGATILKLAGVPDPSVYGYTGRILDFLVSR